MRLHLKPSENVGVVTGIQERKLQEARKSTDLFLGSNVWLLQLWEKDVAPMMQSYHLSCGVGALLAPLMMTSFLGPQQMCEIDKEESEEFLSLYGDKMIIVESRNLHFPDKCSMPRKTRNNFHFSHSGRST